MHNQTLADAQVWAGSCKVRIQIIKWYVDAVLDGDSVWIGYAASLKIAIFPVIYWAASFHSSGDGQIQEKQWWHRIPFPSFAHNQWSWSTPLHGNWFWTPEQTGTSLTLLHDASGIIRWTCHAPKSACQGSQRTGQGYVEEISIDLARARLPFQALWWGRAHIGHESLTWIRWAEGLEQTWLLRNGSLVAGSLDAKDDGAICATIGEETWTVTEKRTLRHRDLRKQLPSWLIALTGTLPLAREHKFLGEATLQTTTQPTATGLAIGEMVQWE